MGVVTQHVSTAAPRRPIETTMFRSILLVLPFLAAPVLPAQTIGAPGVNDIEVTMPPSLPTLAGSASTSCAFNAGLHSPVNFGILQYRVSAGASAVATLLFLSFCPPCGGASTINFGSTVPVACGGGNGGACLGGPPNANLCWALNLSPGCWLNAFMIPAGAGFFHIRIPVPPSTAFPGTLWAQALIVDPCSTPGWHMTPAIGID
jgi:hypothetical protein